MVEGWWNVERKNNGRLLEGAQKGLESLSPHKRPCPVPPWKADEQGGADLAALPTTMMISPLVNRMLWEMHDIVNY